MVWLCNLQARQRLTRIKTQALMMWLWMWAALRTPPSWGARWHQEKPLVPAPLRLLMARLTHSTLVICPLLLLPHDLGTSCSTLSDHTHCLLPYSLVTLTVKLSCPAELLPFCFVVLMGRPKPCGSLPLLTLYTPTTGLLPNTNCQTYPPLALRGLCPLFPRHTLTNK